MEVYSFGRLFLAPRFTRRLLSLAPLELTAPFSAFVASLLDLEGIYSFSRCQAKQYMRASLAGILRIRPDSLRSWRPISWKLIFTSDFTLVREKNGDINLTS